MYITLFGYAQQTGIGPVEVRGIIDRRAAFHLSQTGMIGRLINLVVPAQARILLAVLVRPQVIVARAVSQQLQRTALAGVVHHFGRIVVRGMVEAFLLRQQTVEKIQPAAAQAHHIRHLIADNRSLQRG